MLVDAKAARDEYEAERPMLLSKGQMPLEGLGQAGAREVGQAGKSAALVLSGRVVVTATGSSNASPPLSSAALEEAVTCLVTRRRAAAQRPLTASPQAGGQGHSRDSPGRYSYNRSTRRWPERAAGAPLTVRPSG